MNSRTAMRLSWLLLAVAFVIAVLTCTGCIMAPQIKSGMTSEDVGKALARATPKPYVVAVERGPDNTRTVYQQDSLNFSHITFVTIRDRDGLTIAPIHVDASFAAYADQTATYTPAHAYGADYAVGAARYENDVNAARIDAGIAGFKAMHP